MNIFSTLFGRQGNTFPLKDLNNRNVSAGLVSGLFALTSVPVLVLEASTNGNFTMTQTILWIFSIFVFGGLYSIVVPLYYRLPIVGANTLTGVAFLATVTGQFSYNELIGAYILSGVLMLLVGYFGAFARLVALVPKEIIAAMLAGMVTKYMVTFIVSITEFALIGGGALLTFFVFRKWLQRIPPLLGAITVGSILLLLTEPLNQPGVASSMLIPVIQIPEFSFLSFIAVSIPLALLILSNDAAVGIGALEQNDYQPPVNQIVSLSGIFSIVAGLFGGQSANVAGMMTAICADEEAGPKEKRYMGAVVTGVIFISFGLLAWMLMPFIQALPQAFISILVGFALIGVFSNSMHIGFSNPQLKISSVFTFIIAMSGVTMIHISAPIWALVIGTFVARYVENDRVKDKVEKKKRAV